MKIKIFTGLKVLKEKECYQCGGYLNQYDNLGIENRITTYWQINSYDDELSLGLYIQYVEDFQLQKNFGMLKKWKEKS